MTGLFAKLIPLPTIIIIFCRVVVASVFLRGLLFALKKSIKLESKKDFYYLAFCSLILAIHWISFIQSIKVSTVAVGLLTFSTFPIFTTLIEPFFFKEKLEMKNIILTLITFTGVALVVPEFDINNNLTQGALWGTCSGLTFALISILNRKMVKKYNSFVMSFYLDSIMIIILLPSLFLIKYNITLNDVLLLILMGIVFTAMAHSIFINGLKTITAHTASIITCLEPLYGIIFAVLLIKEIPSVKEVAGGIIILGATFYATIKSRNQNSLVVPE
jgi:drug/metabolite transporter (DMT)-like permease